MNEHSHYLQQSFYLSVKYTREQIKILLAAIIYVKKIRIFSCQCFDDVIRIHKPLRNKNNICWKKIFS